MKARLHRQAPGAQRGLSLILGMIMLVLITLVVINAFTLSSSNLKTAGNTKVRAEAVAAVNNAVEQLVSSNFYIAPVAQVYNVNLNNDTSTFYTVSVAKPTCIRATQASTGAASDVELGTGMTSGDTWFTEWDIDARVTDTVTGSDVRVRQGVRVMMTGAQKNLSCA